MNKSVRISALSVAVLLLSSQVRAGGFTTQLFRFALKHQQASSMIDLMQIFSDTQSSPVKSATFEQKLDPANPSDTRTFQQRYFLNPSYAQGPNSPVFYVICGEGECSPNDLGGSVEANAQAHHAYLVTLEHRFYGQSQPFPALSTENLKYLRSDYALSDLANFEAYAKTNLGMSGPWVVVGGSYSGSLSAYYREKFPTLVVGSLASSAPVQAHENFEELDRTVHDQVTPECATAIRGVVTQIEASLSNADALAKIKAEFQAQDITDSVDFLYVVADMAAMAVQYGAKDKFCNKLMTASDPVAGYAQAGVAMFTAFGITPIQDAFQSIVSEDAQNYEGGFGTRQWFYQSCTEFGYFQAAYHDINHSARSALIDLPFHLNVCAKLFGTTLDTSKITQGYYQPLLQPGPDKIFMTNGTVDPWATISISPALGNATNPGITTATIEGGSHCSDLLNPTSHDSSSLTSARAQFESLLEQWLK